MNIATNSQLSYDDGAGRGSFDHGTRRGAKRSYQPLDVDRADANIELWMTYLPEDCVIAMIKDGWHLTV
jgi:hypothetical protein